MMMRCIHAATFLLLSYSAVSAAPHAVGLRLYGVEIGGPEDGFSLTDRSKYESAKRAGALSIDLRPLWSTIEPAPGRYDWKTLDAALQNAAAVSLPVTITLRFFDQHVPAWLAAENMLDQDGNTHFGYSGFKSRSPSYWGPRARSSYLRLIEELVKRYRANPAILAWQFFYGYNDSFYLGMWQNRPTVYDYSKFSQEKYRSYLSEVRKFSLVEVNRRYGTSYGSWEEVSQPKPTFGTLNISAAWHDFQDYRMWSIERMFDDMFSLVRRFDSRPLIMYYGGSLHHSAHQLSVYDIGLRLLKRYGGLLDVTCFEDPVPAEVGAGIVRSYDVPLMVEAWQVPPPAPDFRRLFFHVFSQGARAYQLVGSWERMRPTPDGINMGGAKPDTSAVDWKKQAPTQSEFLRTRRVFLEMSETQPIRMQAAGLFSYRSILSYIPARHYINPTLALIPVLQEHQISLDWHSDMSTLEDLDRYPALLDANSEVLEHRVIERLAAYVEKGGRLALLARSGRYALEEGRPDYPLLQRLDRPKQTLGPVEIWPFGSGHVMRISAEHDWSSAEGTGILVKLMEWMGVDRPVIATPGILAAVSRGPEKRIYVTLLRQKSDPGEGMFRLRAGLLDHGRSYGMANLFDDRPEPRTVEASALEAGLPVIFAPHELKVLRLTPQ
ncbi:MAG: beta-galactosidase [Bryobacteraceae bacterium]